MKNDQIASWLMAASSYGYNDSDAILEINETIGGRFRETAQKWFEELKRILAYVISKKV